MADGRVTIKTNVDDKSLKDLRSTLKDLENAFKNLQTIDPFSGISQDARNLMREFAGLSNSASQVDSDIDSIDGESIDGVSSSANEAGASLDSTADSAKNTDGSIEGIDGKSIDDVTSSADEAGTSLESTAQSADKADSSLEGIDGKTMDDVSSSADEASTSLGETSDSAKTTDASLDSIDGKNVGDVSKEADRASTGLEDTASAADKTDSSLDGVDGKNVGDVSKEADKASSSLGDTATSADRADASLDSVDGQSLDGVSKEAEKAEKSIEGADKETNKFSISLKDVAKSAVVVNAVTKAFDILTASLDDAIARFDTLNTFPRTMEMIGYETAVVDRSTRSLVRGIEGLPTKLDDVIQTAQRLGGMTGDLDDATETTLALNNAFLASGASAMDASRGTEQYIQMLGNGKVDMQSWRTLQESMNYALLATAESFGYTQNGVQQLYNALKGGDITFDQFNKRLQELNVAQGGFADLAIKNSEGIMTSWTNLQTAISRGLETVIAAVDDVVVALSGKNIAQNLNNFKGVIDSVFGAVGSTITNLTPLIKLLYDAFLMLVDVLRALEPVIWGVVAAITAFKVITTVQSLWTKLTTSIGLAQTAMQLFSAVALTTGNGMLTFTGIQAGLSAVLGGVATSAGVASGALGVLNTVITALSGPIGWVAAGIGALVAGGVAIYNTFIKASEETQALGQSLKDTADETAELNDLVDQTASSYEKSKEATKGQFEATRELAAKTSELAEQEFLSAGEKKILKDNIDELNESVDGLNLAYDEEQGRLIASNDAMLERIKMAEEDAKYNEARERSTEIQEQHAEATSQLAENERELAEAQEYLDSLEWYQSSGEAKDGIEQLKEENERLTEQIGVLGEEQLRVDEEIQASAQARAEAEEIANQQRISSLEQLNDKQQEVAEAIRNEYQSLVEKAQDWSTAIETEYTKTNEAGEEYVVSSREAFNDAKATLEQNVEAMREWAENLDALAKRGVDDGILEQLRAMGPEGLPLVEGFVNASDEELSEMESLFGESAELSKEALKSGLAIENGTIIEGAEGLIFNTGETLTTAVQTSGIAQILPDELSKGKEDMEKAGEDIARGASDGIKRGTPEAEDASRIMAEDINTGFRTALMIQSPSKVFVDHGKNIGLGVKGGIEQSKGDAVSAIKDLANELTTTMEQSINKMNVNSDTGFAEFVKTIEQSFRSAVNTIRTQTTSMDDVVRTSFNAMVNNVRTNMNQVPPLIQSVMNQSVQTMMSASGQSQTAGRMLGLGFYNGLNSTTSSILSLASSIAQSAVSRINSALKVRSPSREGYESGDFLGQGLWLGMKHQVGNVEKWSDRLGQSALIGMLKPTPLGMNTQFTAAMEGGYSGTTDSRTIHHDNGVTIHIENIENKSDSDIPRILEESAWIMGRERGRLE